MCNGPQSVIKIFDKTFRERFQPRAMVISTVFIPPAQYQNYFKEESLREGQQSEA